MGIAKGLNEIVIPNPADVLKEVIVKSRRYLSTLAISVYALLFLFAVWSVVPSSFPGSGLLASRVVEPQLAACELGTGAAGGQQGSQVQLKDGAGKGTGAWYGGWTGAGTQDVYSCALLTGASYN